MHVFRLLVVAWSIAAAGCATLDIVGPPSRVAMPSTGRPEGSAAVARSADPESAIARCERLFATCAPAFEVDEAGNDDRIGAPVLDIEGLPGVDASLPVAYTHLAHTRNRGRLLPQLVYVAWFAARPAAFPGDPLAGRLDALVWRVTLAPDGAPLVFDSIHACGCYHLFFFWPMGIPSPGAMRQWGRHATAFVGRRHFDQQDLLEKSFVLRLPEPSGRH